MEEIRKEFLDKEPSLYAIIDQEASNFSKYELNDMKSYLKEFFDILKDDDHFQESILDQCRTK